MPYVLVEDFKGGIDTRRTVVTSVPGSCVTLTNAHVTRGGEIEKRRAFKLWATLPAGTHGLAAGGGRIFVFGSVTTPSLTGLPPSLSYVRFQHLDLSTAMTGILGLDFFGGNVYAAAQFTDGKVYHYWDGYAGGANPANRIDDWYEARARTYFNVTGGTATGTAATATFTVAGGTSTPGNNLNNLRINNVDILTGPIAHTGSNDTTGAAIAAAIGNLTSIPNYTAVNSSGVVTITSATAGTAPNGLAITDDVEGDFTVAAEATLTGGIDNAITNITVNSVPIIQDPILWETSDAYTATKIRDEINKTRTDPEWESTSVESSSRVNIIAYERGELLVQLHNNLQVVITKTGNFAFTPTPQPANTVAGAGSSTVSYSPGGFVRALDDKMHCLSDSNWHFSNVAMPTDWNNTEGGASTPDYAGLVNLANHSRGSEELMAIAPYFQNVAIFGKDAIQIWNHDPNPDNSTRVQVLNNTGTVAGKSVVEIGDSDVFYLARSGIRSLKARDSSNSGYVSDIGNPIDDLVVADINVNVSTTENACGIVDPRDGRYLLSIGSKVYVFSYFPSSKVSAWSIYEHGFVDSNGDPEPITDWAYDGQELLCRAGDKIYSLGGEKNNEYDSSPVTVQLPFLDAKNPATDKMWTGLDAVCSSDWDISTGTDPTDIAVYEPAATINKTTYGLGRVGLSSTSTHLALRMVNTSPGAATLGNIAVHYTEVGSG
jgi:hypothetical protein